MHTAIAKKAFSIKEASQASTLSPSTIRNRIADGSLRAGRIGRRVIIRAEALDEFITNAADARVA
ncbi:helix-turn-helix domain-containing protein [Sphingopyxis sp.]|uniref:helix-turn-helix domain-containing protein n=1 Tax=Sphingopyxis sp. TaxID=1908224 RepID=UPI001D9C6290|nr:helix-turn-helix domain-containing protein [Sphingopyxis sp.]MBW8294745.1 excisionase family DNA-binding protein [Sphingopyxis sp.]